MPSGHSWVVGLSYSPALNYGLKSLAIARFKKKILGSWVKGALQSYRMCFEKSCHLNTLYRLGLEISNVKKCFTANEQNSLKRYLVPNVFLGQFIGHRSLVKPIHSKYFFWHNQNYILSSYMPPFNTATDLMLKGREKFTNGE
jgi:hypothetical protein